ncbi:MAG TPA: Rne/Rng family ribonuclease [Candidatus Dormibacteraeota bacterium]|nr:Rne/Rng family ribonuclease [Candidatus Dormibacteraeota bacterium]
MNKELFVSSTPHETKVGLVEDDLLAEVYMERENEYTLAGSIYKGRVTRVLPGMQSAFVDIGLERDAFLYVSDFMELEEHDDDLTDVVPANRGVQDLRPQQPRAENASAPAELAGATDAAEPMLQADIEEGSVEAESEEDAQPAVAAENAEPGNGGDSQGRERGGWRGRGRRRRGGRRDQRPERGSERSDRGDRAPEPRMARPVETVPSRPAGPPAGYQPILLPGESISKYQRFSQPPVAQPARLTEETAEVSPERLGEPAAPLAATFPEDEPIFAAGEAIAEPLHEEHEDTRATPEEPVESAATSVNWNREFRQPETVSTPALAWTSKESTAVETAPAAQFNQVEEHEIEEHEEVNYNRIVPVAEPVEEPTPVSREEQPPVFATPGTMEEETIDEEEADTIHYQTSSDDGYEEFEEETQAAGPHEHLNGDAREAVSEIHMASMTESGEAQTAEGAPAEGEEDSEEFELEEAQAQAEALLDAEARGNGTVDARVEVRAPSSTAGYTQRSPRQRPGDRPGYERRGGGDRGRRGGGRSRFRRRESAPVPLISDLLKEGQEILVQIAKEPIGKKGARITSHIALPGRFLVYMPTVNHTGVSRKISSEEERQRLKRIIMSERENGHGGFIVRTAAQSASEEELRADIRFLKGLWQDIKNRAESSKPPALIYHDLNVVERVLRDQVTSDFNVIWVDTEPEYERILRFFNRFQPGMVKRVKLYTKETPLFEQFGLQEEMNKALKSKVWLKSGGYIVINQTEALVAIDINTGKYVGKTARLEDTIVKTNVDAIKEIVRQIRLRDLGGIIIIDFIDMDERRNRQRVMQALEEELRHDRAPSKTLQFNDFGLVAITRKRVKQSLERTIGAPCPYCQSTGYVKSVTTICNEIYVEMRKIAKHLEHEDVMLRVHPDVAKELKSNNAKLLNEMEELTKRTIIIKSDPAVHQEQFDIN